MCSEGTGGGGGREGGREPIPFVKAAFSHSESTVPIYTVNNNLTQFIPETASYGTRDELASNTAGNTGGESVLTWVIKVTASTYIFPLRQYDPQHYSIRHEKQILI
jgi:hypothetical protein